MLPRVNPAIDASHIFIACDWLHIIWRLRQRFLKAALTLELGGMPVVPSRLFGDRGRRLGITAADTDAKNKQSLEGRPLLAAVQQHHLTQACRRGQHNGTVLILAQQ